MADYKAIFDGIESTLLDTGSQRIPRDKILHELEPFKHYAGRRLTDDEYFRNLVHITFYSGFRASTVSEKLHIINQHFPNYLAVSDYGNKEIEAIISDEEMIKNRAKIQACLSNAKVFKQVILEFGSFANFVDSLPPTPTDKDLIRLRDRFRKMFKFLGVRTAFHFMMDIGLDVLKPDRVIERIFKRLGLVGHDLRDDALYVALVQEGRKFSQATGLPIRYVDIIVVAYGQMQSEELGLRHGICVEVNPQCSICRASNYCAYGKGLHLNANFS